MACFHPSDEWLALYASGALEEHLEMLIAIELRFSLAVPVMFTE